MGAAQQPPQAQFTSTFPAAAGPSTHAVQVQVQGGGGIGTGSVGTAPVPGVPGGGPLVATGDWTKDLVQLAKTAELKCVPFRVPWDDAAY